MKCNCCRLKIEPPYNWVLFGVGSSSGERLYLCDACYHDKLKLTLPTPRRRPTQLHERNVK